MSTVPRNASERATVVSALLTVQVLFGVHYLAAKDVLDFVEPRVWAVLRVAGAAVLLWTVVVALRRPLPCRPRDVAQLALFSVFGIVVNQVCFVEGLARTTPIHASLIMTSIPVTTLLVAVVLRREALTRRKLAALLVALAGVMLVMRPDRADLLGGTLVGDALTLINATSFSVFLVISKRLLARIDTLAATAVLFGFGTVGILAVGAPRLVDFDPSAVPPEIWWIGAFIVLGPTAGTYLLNYWALARVDSSMVALFIYLQPLIAGLLSVTLRGERPEATTLAGGVLICAAVYAVSRRPTR